MKAEIEIENYLSEKDMREAALDAFRSMVARSLERNEKYYGGVGAWISNMAYCSVLEECGRYVDGGGDEIRNLIAEQVDKHIDDLSAHMIYQYDYNTGKPMNEGARIVEAAVVVNREKIEKRVEELLYDISADSLRNEIADTVERFTDKWLRGGVVNDIRSY